MPAGATEWQPGPALVRPRAEAAAQVLADGSVLVAGGWDQDVAGNLIASTASERWTGQGDFVPTAPLAVAVARMRALPGVLPLADSLLADPQSAMVQAYTLATGQWRVVAELPWEVNRIHGPYVDGEGAWLLAGQDVAPVGSGWQVLRLRLGVTAVSKASQLIEGVPFRRDAAGLLPGVGNDAALVVGGIVRAHTAAGGPNAAAVDRLGVDGQLRSLPSLQQPRRDARVFRLPDGALVVAGGHDVSRRQAQLEWLASEDAGVTDVWQPLPLNPEAHYGQQADGALLALTWDRTLTRIRVTRGADGRPDVQLSELPRLPETRIERDGYHPPRPVGLADGRILVVDGHTGSRRIAVLDPLERAAEAACPDAVVEGLSRDCEPAGWYLNNDEYDDDATIVGSAAQWSTAADPPAAAPGDWPEVYQGYGRLERSRHYLVLEPGATQWRSSARSGLEGDAVAVLPDGRVVRVGLLPRGAGDSGPRPVVLDISSADGHAWERLPELPYSYWGIGILVVDGELFAYGPLRKGGASAVFHLDFARQAWHVVRDSDRHPRLPYRVARLFALTLADGRQFLLPESLPEL